MKTKHGILFSFVALLLATMFTFTGCPTEDEEDDPPPTTVLTGTTWTYGSGYSSVKFEYVGASTWKLYTGSTPTTDSTSGYGTYELSGTTVTMKAAGTIMYTGTLDSASAPTRITVSGALVFTKQ